MKKKGVTTKQWDEESFFKEVVDNLDNETIKAIKKLYEFTNKIADVVVWGTGSMTGSYNLRINKISNRTIYTVRTNGVFAINRWPEDYEDERKLKDKICKELSKIEGLEKYLRGFESKTYVTIPHEAWTPVVDEIIKKLEQILKF